MKKLTHGNSLSASPNYEQHNIYNSVVTNFILCSNELLRNSEFQCTALIDLHQAINFCLHSLVTTFLPLFLLLVIWKQ